MIARTTARPRGVNKLLAAATALVLAGTGAVAGTTVAHAVPGDVAGGTLSWGLSEYLNSANFGRPNPLPDAYTSPAVFDETTRVSSWGGGSGSIAADGSAELAFEGATLNFAKSGGGWLKLADPQIEIDGDGNGAVSALVSYGTSTTGTPPNMEFDPAQAPTRGPERLDIVVLVDNAVAATHGEDSVSWSGLAGLWGEDFIAFLAGDGDAIGPWSYATTVTNTGTADRLPTAFDIGLGIDPTVTPEPGVFIPTDYDLGTAEWGLSEYLNSANFGRPNPLPDAYTSPAVFDEDSRISSWGDGSGSIAADGSAELAFEGATLNFAKSGGGWLKLADLEATLDAQGNGTVSALVSYGTSTTGTPPNMEFDPAQASTRGPERLDVVVLRDNATAPVQGEDSATWAGLTGQWDEDFVAFLAGDGDEIGPWSYATTVTNTGTADRLPTAFDFELGIEPATTPEPGHFVPTDYDLGTAEWGLSEYLNSANFGRPNPLPDAYTSPAVFDETTRVSSWGGGSGSIAADGSAELAFEGATLNFAKSGGGWLELADLEATLDAQGNGVVSALVSYGTSTTGTPPNMEFDPAQAPTRGPERLDIVVLAGNTVAPVQGADSVSWSGLAGLWSEDFIAFLAGDGDAIGPWSYATTVTNTGTADRLPTQFSFELGQKPPAPAPTVTLSASPSGSSVQGTAVKLTASVSPAAIGTIQFRNGSTVLGSAPVTATVSTVAVTVTTLPVGNHSLVASFVPTDPASWARASSPALHYEVFAPLAAAPGQLSWGIKSAFRNYVTGPIAHGSVQVSGDATMSGGIFRFPQSSGGSFDTATGLGSANYRGTVFFSGHDGALTLVVSNPIVRITGSSSAVLSATVTGLGRVDLATLNLAAGSRSVGTGGAVSYSSVPATLTAAGAGGFAGFYGAGEPLDPVSFTIGSADTSTAAPASVSAANSDPANEADDVAPTSEGLTVTGDLVEGGEITATADGFRSNEEGILVVIYSEPLILERNLVADANGVATWTGRLPAGLTGEHTLTFQGSVDRGVVLDIASRDIVGCLAESGSLSWGYKESFRSYLTSTIAHGEWTVGDGASYETPEFEFPLLEGSYDQDGAEGTVSFGGSVRFTGHEGVLDTTVANPSIRFVDAETAIMSLDVTGDTQSGESVNAPGIAFVEIDLSAATVTTEGSVITIADAPTVLLDTGAAAFGTYPAGDPFDPVTLEIVLTDDCGQAAPVEPEPTETDTPVEPIAGQDLSWLIWLIGGIVALLIIVIVIVAVLRRRASA